MKKKFFEMTHITIFVILLIVLIQQCTSRSFSHDIRSSLKGNGDSPISNIIAVNQNGASKKRQRTDPRQTPPFAQPQQQQRNYYNPITNTNPSRFRALISEVGVHSITILFAGASWRLIGIYDFLVTDPRSLVNTLSKFATVSFFVLNFTAVVLQIFKPLVFKSFLKIVVALDVLREFFSIAFNLLAAFYLNQSQRDLFLGRIIANLFWASAFFSFSRSRWVFQPKQVQQRGTSS